MKSIIRNGCLLGLACLLLLLAGCAPSLEFARTNFYGYEEISSELDVLSRRNPDIVSITKAGETYEGRSLYVVRVGQASQAERTKPGLMTVFAQHAGEHETTSLAVGVIKYLAENYQKDKTIAGLLKNTELWIVPMMNPDGVAYDLSGAVTPFSWRKNRRPTGPQTYGVDLNRNWESDRHVPVPEGLLKQLTDRESSIYAGDTPFSEAEIRAVRDFLLSHPNIKVFVDYHSGYANFMQGGVGCFTGRSSAGRSVHPDTDKLCQEVIETFANVITDPEDKRPGFLVASRADAAKVIRERVPFYMKLFIPARLPEAPGTAVEYVYDQLGIIAIGVEIFRDGEFLNNLPSSQDRLVKNHVRGVLLLLEVLANKHAADNQ